VRERKLRLSTERLTELTPDELRGVAGGDPLSNRVCATGANTCGVSDWFISMCGCLTNYCSIDVC
jgi:hypothetical protein